MLFFLHQRVMVVFGNLEHIIIVVITERVIVTTKIAAQEISPLRLKFLKPDLIILFNKIIILIHYIT